MLTKSHEWWTRISVDGKKSKHSDSSYEKLLTVIVGSCYVHLHSNVQNEILRIRNEILGMKKIICIYFYLLFKYFNLGDNKYPSKQVVEIQNSKFINTGALGRLPTILFWNDPQRQLIMRIRRKEHIILMGDYGTGQLYMNHGKAGHAL